MKPKTKKLRLILIMIVSLWLIAALIPLLRTVPHQNPFIIGDDAMPVLIAHGGGNKEFPDNTLEAFYHAYSVDSRCMMETDVSITKDGVIILSHDTTLDRKTTLRYQSIVDVNYSDLIEDEVDFGYHNAVEPSSNGFNVSGVFTKYTNEWDQNVTPLDVTYPEGVTPRHTERFLATTLEELIIAFPENKINIEIKQSGDIGILALNKVIELMDELDDEYQTFERIVLASFHKEIYHRLIELNKTTYPQLYYSPESGGVIKFFALSTLRLDLFYNDPITVLQVPISQYGIQIATKSFVRTAHRHGIAVHFWTIDDEDEMDYLIQLGVDGIMTNVPSRLKSVYERTHE